MAAILFRDLAREWWENTMLEGNLEYAEESWRRLERDLLQYTGEREAKRLTAPQFLKVLRRIEKRGTLAVARKVKSHASQIMQYGIACGHILRNPVRDLGAALKQKKSIPRPALLEARDIGRLMMDIERLPGSNKTPTKIKRQCMLKLTALLFPRPGTICQGEWEEFDMGEGVWKIPGHKMKMKKPHAIPLPKQALETLWLLRSVTGHSRWLFPSRWNKEKHETGRVLNLALRRMGYSGDVMTAHGFRAMAATMLREEGWPSEVIERQLAHEDKNAVRAAYQRSELLGQRRQMLQAWGDWLDMRCGWAMLGK